ncbi:lanthionine synthetase C-like protein [Kordia sp. SMS9]|uniref:lanthionine synthetase C family protein n=1 Tax=Kordia sp. SMS9 TaxID=2282170 RepID=UPI000E0CCEBE|nr:lanthionine synthetase C family protein [Kordia sp. SMS9]AXG68592.1 lanthionine synthetase C-like protein [Kordia sp. SMS9]
MNKELLEKKLKEIDQIIKSKYEEETQIGVLAGLGGISLFEFYYSKYLDIDDHADIGVEMLTNCIDKINEGYSYPTFCTGIAGAGWVLDHLEQEEFMDADNDDLLPELDQYIYTFMVTDMKNGNYDFLHGAIGYAFYFLNRYRNTKSDELKEKYRGFINEFIDLLEGLSEDAGDGKLRWESELSIETKERGYNLSLSHGMSSIVGILTKFHEQDDFKEKSEPLLKGAVKYILNFKTTKEDPFSIFPSWVTGKEEDENAQSRLAWCYGDLGVAMRFWYASKTLNDEALGKTALEVLKHAAKRTAVEDSLVRDAGICHGSYGNAQMFLRMYKETGDQDFKDAFEFWIQDGINRGTFEDGYAGYKQWKGVDKSWAAEVSLLEGIAGIGLSILDYLADYDTNWDECLMIS